MPCQHLKTALHDIVRQKRDAAFFKKHAYLEEFGEMDHEMVKEIINGIGPKEQRIYKHIATGAMWNENEIQQICEQDNTCKHCGELVHDSTHVLWHCCAINKHRKHTQLNNITIEGIPKAVLYGLPLSMGWKPTKAFWHKTGDNHECDIKMSAML